MNESAHSESMMNYHKIDDRLATGGHFIDDGLAVAKNEGVAVVVDLRDEPPRGQEQKLAAKGIEWINIPVVWTNPTPEDFERFVAAMSTIDDQKVIVQCAANYRASAMTYLYRVVVEQIDERIAAQDLYAVWEPNDQWRDYIAEIIESSSRPDQ